MGKDHLDEEKVLLIAWGKTELKIIGTDKAIWRRRGALIASSATEGCGWWAACPPPGAACRGAGTGTLAISRSGRRAGAKLRPHRRFGGVRALAAPVLPTPLSPLQTGKLRPKLGAGGGLRATLPSPWPCVGSRSEPNSSGEAPI